MFLIRIILFLFLLYIIIKVISALLAYSLRSSRDNMAQGFGKKKEGEVHINNPDSGKKKIIKKEEGEYVKFEEIKDE